MSDELSLDNYTEYNGSDFEAEDFIDEWQKSNTIRHADTDRVISSAQQLYNICSAAMKQNFKESLKAMEEKWL